MKTTAILIASIVLLSACSGQGAWTKGKTNASPNRDILECQYEANKFTPSDGIYGQNTTIKGGLFRQCMGLRGWSWGEVKK